MHRRAIAFFIAALAISACAHNSSAPFTPQLASPSDALVAAAVTSGNVLVSIIVPKSTIALRSHYVSPSTKSIEIALYNRTGKTLLTRKAFNVQPRVRGCKPSTSGLKCSFMFSVAAGKERVDVTTYDKPGEKGNKLAALLKFPLTVRAKGTTRLPMSLGGLAASIAVIPPVSESVTGTQTGGFSIVGNLPQTFTIVPQDADANYIVGTGAPKITLGTPPSNATIGQASGTTWTLTSTFKSAASPTTPATTTLAMSAAPVLGSGGKTVRVSVPLALYQPWIYVVNYYGGTVTAYDEEGNGKTLTGSFPGIMSQPQNISYAPASGWLYVSGYGGASFLAYDVMGNAQTPSGGFPNTNGPGQVAFDPHNSWIYVPNNGANTTNYVTAYDAAGDQEPLSSGAFSAMANGAWLMAYAAGSNDIYAANFNTNVVAGYSEDGTAVTSVGAFPNVDQSFGLAFDSENQWVYVSNHGTERAVTVYDASGNQLSPSGGFTVATFPYGIAYDPYNDRLYVANVFSAPGSVMEFDGEGNNLPLGSGAFSNVNYPWGIAVVP